MTTFVEASGASFATVLSEANRRRLDSEVITSKSAMALSASIAMTFPKEYK